MQVARARPDERGLALLLGLLFLGVSGGLALAQHLTFHTRARDMGIYLQILWNAAQGRPFLSTLLESNTNHLAEHIAPALWPLVPLFGATPSAMPLLLLQQLALTGCGLPVWLVARRMTGRWPALWVLLAFYLMPAMSRVSFSEFHPVVLAALPAAAGVGCAVLGKPRSAALLLLFALLVEEEAAPTALGLAGLLLVQRLRNREPAGARAEPDDTPAIRRSTLPLALAATSIAYALMIALLVMPSFRLRGPKGELVNRALEHYELIWRNPEQVVSWLGVERGPDAAAWLLLPAAGLPLLAPVVLGITLPGFIVLFLQDRTGTYAGHWSAPLLPVVWLAVAVGLGRLANRRMLLGAGLALIGAGTGLAYQLDSFFPGGREFEADHFQYTEAESDLRRAVELVEPGASLAASRRVVPQLALRRELYQFPFTFYSAPLRPDGQRFDFYILDLNDSPTRRAIEVSESDSVLEKRPRYHVRRFGESVLLLSRTRPESARPRSDSFAGTLRLIGLEGPDVDGSGLALGLTWEALRRPDSELVRTVRLVGPGGLSAGELSGRPLDDYLAIRDWDRGQVVSERRVLQLPAALAAGTYQLMVNWQSTDGQPLALDDSGEPELELASVELS